MERIHSSFFGYDLVARLQPGLTVNVFNLSMETKYSVNLTLSSDLSFRIGRNCKKLHRYLVSLVFRINGIFLENNLS